MEKFFRSAGRVASLAFENWVEQALRAIPGIEVVRRPRTQHSPGRRGPDFIISRGGRRIVVEAYLPEGRPSTARLRGRIMNRTRFVSEAESAALLVVLPNGYPSPALGRVDSADDVAIMSLDELEGARHNPSSIYDLFGRGGR
jgi:hypothetical protein